MHYFSLQYYFNLRYPIPIVLLLDQGEIVKFVYNWLTGENGGAAKSSLAPPPKKHAPRLDRRTERQTERHTMTANTVLA